MFTHDVWKAACPSVSKLGFPLMIFIHIVFSKIDCNASLQAANQEPYPGPTQMNRDNAPLSPFETFENFNPMQPFFQEDYPSQRFRPQKHEEKSASEQLNKGQQSDVYDPYYSPPETFMPSESSDAISVELPRPNTSPSVERLVSQYTKLPSTTLISSKDQAGAIVKQIYSRQPYRSGISSCKSISRAARWWKYVPTPRTDHHRAREGSNG